MRTPLLTTTAVMALLSASTVSTRAQTNWTGATSNDWFTAANWTAGVPVLGGSDANINVTLPNATVVGVPGAVAQRLVVGRTGVGNLTIQNGGTLLTFTGGVVGFLGRGDVTVTGAGSNWTNVNGGIQVGSALPNSIGTLTVADGGSVNDTPSGTPGGGLITVGGGGGFRGALIGNGSVTSTLTQINAGGFLVPGQGIVAGQGGTPDAMRFIGNLAFQVRRVLRRAGQSHDGLDHQCVRRGVACRHRSGQLRARQLRLAPIHHFDGSVRYHRHLRRARQRRLAGRLRDATGLRRQQRNT